MQKQSLPQSSVQTEKKYLLLLPTSKTYHNTMKVHSQIDDREVVCILFVLYEKNEVKDRQKLKRRHWIHSLNLKRPKNGQFQVTFMTLRNYLEEFFKYYRMSISSFDELVSKNINFI